MHSVYYILIKRASFSGGFQGFMGHETKELLKLNWLFNIIWAQF